MKRKPVEKKPLDPRRIRSVPPSGFSWIDRRFVRDGFLERLEPEAAFLYFFLLAVSDARGLSFYSDPRICEILKLNGEELSQSRARLSRAELILYEYPLYQVLPLPELSSSPSRPSAAAESGISRGGDPLSLQEMLKLAIERARGTEETS